jgi:hypothetical protein
MILKVSLLVVLQLLGVYTVSLGTNTAVEAMTLADGKQQ